MTVSTTTLRNDYAGNGVTTAFTIGFYFLDNTHIQVIQTTISTGISVTLALTTNYTVSGAGAGAGGTLTMLVAPTSDQRISILRNVPFTQLSHYVPNDPFPAATHEAIVDQLTMEAQQLKENINRAVVLSAGSASVNAALPTPIAGQILGWDGTGTNITNMSPVSGSLVSSVMAPVVAASTLASARSLLSVPSTNDEQNNTYTAFTTAGTSTAFTLTPTPATAALATNQQYLVTFNAAAGTTPTLAVSGLTAKNLKYYDSTGTKQAVTSTQVPSGWKSRVQYDGTDYVVLDIPTPSSTSKIQPITASVAANALTLTLNPTTLDFRSTTLGSGTVTTVSNPTAISTVISSGSTGGTTNGVQSDIYVAAINNAGTMEIAWVNGSPGDETALISTTAEGGAGAADSANVWYSTTARTNVAYRVVGLIRSTQATAGTWATAPSLEQGIGGRALLSPLFLGATAATTSGTSIDYTGLPTVSRITIMFNGVSTNGTSQLLVQIGSGSVLTSGYNAEGFGGAGGGTQLQYSNGFGIAEDNAAARNHYGTAVLTHMGGNVWTFTASLAVPATKMEFGAGQVALGGVLDRIRLTTAGGADTFDAGSINIMYE